MYCFIIKISHIYPKHYIRALLEMLNKHTQLYLYERKYLVAKMLNMIDCKFYVIHNLEERRYNNIMYLLEKNNIPTSKIEFINHPNKNELTFDHLLPRSKGGKTNWENVVTACSSCNVQKGGRLLEKSGMKLEILPFAPTTEDLHKNGKNFPPNFLHESWMDYLYWDVELEN